MNKEEINVEVRIQLDHSQINYTEITNKILEQIENLTYDDIVKRYSIDDGKIEQMVLSKLNNELSNYLIKNTWSTNTGITKIDEVSKEYLQSKLYPMIDKILEEIGSEKIINIIVNIIPYVLLMNLNNKIIDYTVTEEIEKVALNQTFENLKNILETRGIYDEFRC